MLDRERADFLPRARLGAEQLSSAASRSSCDRLRDEVSGVVDLLHNCAYLDPSGVAKASRPRSPQRWRRRRGVRTKLLDAVVETDEALMERISAARTFRRATSRLP